MQAVEIWEPFLTALGSGSRNFSIDFSPLKIVSTSARSFWSPGMVKKAIGLIKADDRPGAPDTNVFWPGDAGQAGQFLHGLQSAWLPASLLEGPRRAALSDALFDATRHSKVSLHANKGLAGAPPDVVAAARDTAMNPAVLDAFALVICSAGGPPAYPGVPGHEPNTALARLQAERVARAMDELRGLIPHFASYPPESNYFEPNWQQSFWGSNYERLLTVKAKYDPDGLFFMHHGVGSEHWSPDGFMRKS
jgi:hypothetical protein